ncbi:D-glycero-alpha-D-manno-heptose-1,7-bisphosphate 7-phosphatase [Oligoflexus tunisiensis]|uniref:D-glycero-alpha-D-manno-heptose-1,7-bisphosphate 7-phosphatase n=1 Tax=Oligoflexus tunisiensis TaxID=708132 RepID=UPI000A80BAA6|nr:HAD family hydrolase [Oligoflexus tunisiensis]
MRKRAIFLDKDGTLIEDVPYNVEPRRIMLVPGAVEALTCLLQADYELCLISNQSGVALGYFQEDALAAVYQEIERQLRPAAIPLAGFYYCPHHPAGRIPAYAVSCACRKPMPGMILKAARELDIDLSASWFIGDILHDVEAGHRAGCRAILINNGHETEWDFSSALRVPDYTAHSLVEAARYIAGRKGETRVAQ